MYNTGGRGKVRRIKEETKRGRVGKAEGKPKLEIEIGRYAWNGGDSSRRMQ